MILLLLLLACAPEEPLVDEVARGALSLAFPLAETEPFQVVVGVDHDPEVHEGPLGAAICTDYLGRGFPHCYDEHRGTDYILKGGFEAMDAGSVVVLAAADGVVVSAEDGHYDRCRAQGFEITCDGHPMVANHVVLQHAGGVLTRYWHLKKDSVLVAPGEEVRCGEPLGLVGSSGYSSTPHLHFEVRLADGDAVDPYAGPFSQPETWWLEQGPPDGLPGTACPEG